MSPQSELQFASRPATLRPIVGAALLLTLLGGCTVTQEPEPAPTVAAKPCLEAQHGDPWIGNWLGVDKRKGVAGELQVQMILHPDGTMAYTEQLKRPGKSPQSLQETGCWHHEGQTLVMRTTHSNAVAVEQDDPIYTNQYQVNAQGRTLFLRGPEGPLNLKRMPDDYRLPLF